MSVANPTFSPIAGSGWFPGLDSNITCHRRTDERWFRDAMDERIGSVRVARTPPELLEHSPAYFVPGLVALYDRDGRRIEASCLRRKPGLHLAGPERIQVPQSCRIIDDPLLYLGWVQDHWGHFLTEGISRLWARNVYAETRDLRCFTTFGYPLASQVTDYLNLLGLSGPRFIHFDQTVKIETCIVPAASFTDRAEAFCAHLRPSQEVTALASGVQLPSCDQPVYLSRSQLGFGRKLRREAELEQVLASRGARIVYPERLSLREQVLMFNTHRVFIGSWGSAFHSMSLACVPEGLTAHVLCEGIPGPNYLMFDAMLGCASHYVQAMHATPEQPQDWPNLDFTIDVEAFVDYLRGTGCL
jgi:hypothetical protein